MQLTEFFERIGLTSDPSPGVVLVGALVLSLCVYVVSDRIGRLIVRRTTTDLDDIVLDGVRLPISGTVLLVGIWYAASKSALATGLEFALEGLLATVAVVGWTIGLARTSSRLLDWAVQHRDRYPTIVTNRTLPVFDLGAKVFLWGGTAYFLLVAWGVDVSAWVTSAGILGVAIGFASQDTLANLVSGVFILADAPYELGDWVVLDSGERGAVVEIGMRTTRLRTRDDVVVVLPNKVMAGARIMNQSKGGDLGVRTRFKVQLPYGIELPAVQAALVATVASVPDVLPQPEPRIRLRALGASGLEHELLFWVRDPALVGVVTHLVGCAVYQRLRTDGVNVPYPQLAVHLTPGEPPAS